MWVVDMAAAKVAKYAVRESGDSVEVVERPNGGLSIVMVDGQRSGKSAKAISNIAVRKAISLLAEGVRDGAVARATHDYLRIQRGAQVSAELIIISVDLETRTVVISRNSQCPVLIWDASAGDILEGNWTLLDSPTATVGVASRVKPVIDERPLTAGQVIVAFTDGVLHAGSRRGAPLDILATLASFRMSALASAQTLADSLLEIAVTADERRPSDDISVVVIRVFDCQPEDPLEVRRMSVSFPLPAVMPRP
jgi:serine phosphatase RsbU (regulator of sigma subunit)